MHCRRRAPELSATSRLVSIWIIAPVLVSPGRAFQPRSHFSVLQHHPALVLGDRPALLDEDEVAHLEGLLLVVGVEFLGAPHRLLEQRMRVAPLHLDHHGLGVLVGHHHALQNPLRHRLDPQSLLWSAPLRFCACTVLMRAMSRRTPRTREVLSSCPEARWKRRLNCSFLSLTS